MSAAPRVALDTNGELCALLFAQGRLAPLRRAWQQQCLPLASGATAAGLLRALGYPKISSGCWSDRDRLSHQGRRKVRAN